MSTGPTAAKKARTAAESVRSAWSLSTPCTVAPSPRSAAAIAVPIPCAVPVTTATLPASPSVMWPLGFRLALGPRRRSHRAAGDEVHGLMNEDICRGAALDPGDERVDGRRTEFGERHADAGDRHLQEREALVFVEAD